MGADELAGTRGTSSSSELGVPGTLTWPPCLLAGGEPYGPAEFAGAPLETTPGKMTGKKGVIVVSCASEGILREGGG